ncbi:MAG: hypothetical protein ABIF71_02180 [Planctomycetota bacterium]
MKALIFPKTVQIIFGVFLFGQANEGRKMHRCRGLGGKGRAQGDILLCYLPFSDDTTLQDTVATMTERWET